jgi:hypothetical protein
VPTEGLQSTHNTTTQVLIAVPLSKKYASKNYFSFVSRRNKNDNRVLCLLFFCPKASQYKADKCSHAKECHIDESEVFNILAATWSYGSPITQDISPFSILHSVLVQCQSKSDNGKDNDRIEYLIVSFDQSHEADHWKRKDNDSDIPAQVTSSYAVELVP